MLPVTCISGVSAVSVCTMCVYMYRAGQKSKLLYCDR